MSKYQEEKKSKEEEVKTLQEEIHNSRQQMLASMEEVKRLKQEVVEFKEELKKLKDQLSVSENFKESTEALNKFLSLQRYPRDKTGLGYNHKGSSSISHENVENVKCQHDASKDTPRKQKNHKERKFSYHNSAHPPKMKNFRRHAKERVITSRKTRDSPNIHFMDIVIVVTSLVTRTLTVESRKTIKD